ncbi:MAG: hypothetical protein DWI07_02295 [Planctomycetota bacterium]|nr:MAG: hypothetical protein DWI07_02295 [Planctomycetota bacterium]
MGSSTASRHHKAKKKACTKAPPLKSLPHDPVKGRVFLAFLPVQARPLSLPSPAGQGPRPEKIPKILKPQRSIAHGFASQ